MVGIVDDYRIYIRDIHTALDNRCCHKHIALAIDKVHNELLHIARLHSAVCSNHASLRAEAGNHTADILELLNIVMDKVDLTTARQLLLDSIAHKLL